MHCVILRVQLKEPSGKDVDGFDYEEHGGKTIPDEMLAATVIAGIDNSTVAQHLALNSWRVLKDHEGKQNLRESGHRLERDAWRKTPLTSTQWPRARRARRSRKGRKAKLTMASCISASKALTLPKIKKKKINDERAQGQHRKNSKVNGTSVKQRVVALESGAPMAQTPTGSTSASSFLVWSVLSTSAHVAATYAQMTREFGAAAGPQCEAILQDTWRGPTMTVDFGIRMITEENDQETNDVWILYDTASALTVCPCGKWISPENWKCWPSKQREWITKCKGHKVGAGLCWPTGTLEHLTFLPRQMELEVELQIEHWSEKEMETWLKCQQKWWSRELEAYPPCPGDRTGSRWWTNISIQDRCKVSGSITVEEDGDGGRRRTCGSKSQRPLDHLGQGLLRTWVASLKKWLVNETSRLSHPMHLGTDWRCVGNWAEENTDHRRTGRDFIVPRARTESEFFPDGWKGVSEWVRCRWQVSTLWESQQADKLLAKWRNGLTSPAPRPVCLTRGIMERFGPSAECKACARGGKSHTHECRANWRRRTNGQGNCHARSESWTWMQRRKSQRKRHNSVRIKSI